MGPQSPNPASGPPPAAPAASRSTTRPPTRTLRNISLVAGLFSLLLGALMLVSHFAGSIHDPLTAPALIKARERLQLDPTNTLLQAEIRRIDLELRREFFRGLRRRELGAWLLLGGAIIFLLAAHPWATRGTPPPDPLATTKLRPPPARLAALARRTSALAAGLLLLGAIGLALPRSRSLDTALQQLASSGGLGSATPGATALATGLVTNLAQAGPTAARVRQNWPRFRGPDGTGIAHVQNAPTHWNGETGEGILWKTPLASREFNSPVVWDQHLFLSSGDTKERAIEAYDASTGGLLWRATLNKLPPDAGPDFEVPEFTRLSAPTVATDGERVFAIFGTGELLAADFTGRTLWTKSHGRLHNPYGHATSLLVWRNLLLVQIDQAEPEDSRSRLYALDPATGAIRWQVRRSVPSSWATPLVIESAARNQIVTLGEPWVIGYDLSNGHELWRIECLGTDLAPSPTAAGDRLLVVSPWKHLLALRTDGSGDVTRTHQLWSNTEHAPDITSPLTDGKRVYVLQTEGTLAALDLEQGTVLWTQDLKARFHASPSLAAGRLYLVSLDGLTFQIEPGDTFRLLATCPLGDEVFASPAFVDGRLYIRGAKHLWCVGSPDAAPRKLTYVR